MLKKLTKIVAVLAASVVAFMALMVVGAYKARAQGGYWSHQVVGHRKVCDVWDDCRPVSVKRWVWVPYGGREYTLTYSHQQRIAGCQPVRAAVGLEKYNLEEAKDNAVAMWMEAVGLHIGKKFMNPDNAVVLSDRGRGPECYLSATGNRLSEKAAEQAGRQLHQCEFVAHPCPGPVGRLRR